MDQDPYYNLDMLSNSRLGIIKCLRDGLPLFKTYQDALDFGKQFHEVVLEPEKYEENLKNDPSYQKHKHKIAEMKKAAMQNPVLSIALSAKGVSVEHDHFFTERKYDEIKCKAKFDILSEGQETIMDLKTTSEKTLEGFLESMIKYSYYRQAAFYMDHHVTAKRFIFIGVTKSYPHKTFTVVCDINHELVCEGRKEYEDLIDYYLEMPEKVNFKELMS